MKIEKGQKYLCVKECKGLLPPSYIKGKVYYAIDENWIKSETGNYFIKGSEDIFIPIEQAKWAIKITLENAEVVNRWANEVIQGTFVDDSGYVANDTNACHAELQDGYTEIDFETFKEITGMGEEKEFKAGDWVVGWHAYYKHYKTSAWQITNLEGEFISPDYKISITSTSDVRRATAEEIADATQTKIFTIEDVRNGRCAIENDGTVEELNKVLKAAFPNDKHSSIGKGKFYARSIYNDDGWNNDQLLDLPTQSVKLFLSQIEGEKTPIQKAVEKLGKVRVKEIIDEVAAKQPNKEWQPKWGEEVEVSDGRKPNDWLYRTFIGINPNNKQFPYITSNEAGNIYMSKFVRKPLEIHDFTTEQAKQDLAKLHNLNVNQIKIVE